MSAAATQRRRLLALPSECCSPDNASLIMQGRAPASVTCFPPSPHREPKLGMDTRSSTSGREAVGARSPTIVRSRHRAGSPLPSRARNLLTSFVPRTPDDCLFDEERTLCPLRLPEDVVTYLTQDEQIGNFISAGHARDGRPDNLSGLPLMEQPSAGRPARPRAKQKRPWGGRGPEASWLSWGDRRFGLCGDRIARIARTLHCVYGVT